MEITEPHRSDDHFRSLPDHGAGGRQALRSCGTAAGRSGAAYSAGDEAVPDSTTRFRDHAFLVAPPNNATKTTRRPRSPLFRNNLADVPQATSTRSRGKESQTRKRQANKGSLTIGLLVPRLRSNFRLRRVLSASLGDAVARLCSELVAPRVGGGD